MSTRGFRAANAMTDFDHWLRINIGSIPTTGDKMAVDWFAHQTDSMGTIARAELKRRELLEAEDR